MIMMMMMTENGRNMYRILVRTLMKTWEKVWYLGSFASAVNKH